MQLRQVRRTPEEALFNGLLEQYPYLGYTQPVDPQRFRGTCYRAANWISLGMTTGRGKDDREHKVNRPIKEVLGYPLVKDFRERLSQLPPPPPPRLDLQLGALQVRHLSRTLQPEPT